MTERISTPPGVTLLITRQCSHCAAVLQLLTGMVKQAEIARLEIINLEQDASLADSLGVRSVPWIKIGERVFEGALSAGELRYWIENAQSMEAETAYLGELLQAGKVDQVLQRIEAQSDRVMALVPLMDDADAKINLRLGIGVVFEHFAGTAVLQNTVSALAERLRHRDARVRGDACYYLALTRRADVVPLLRACLDDDHADVREAAQDGLDELGDLVN